MSSSSRLGRQLAEVLAAVQAADAPCALIGGLALASHRVTRSTQDVDLLVDIVDADNIESEFLKLGYACLYRSDNAANYTRGDERVDLLYASRPVARRLLQNAKVLATSLGDIPVISAEGLIGFKLQGFINNPRRTQDLEDIRALLRTNKSSLNMDEVREYFRLFDKEALLKELLDEA